MELLPPSLKKLWNEWQLQTLVLLSLVLQIILIILGNRRKYINKIWIKIILWPAYLVADFIATTALAILTNRLAYHSGPVGANLELTAFWAPFLLLHLGGPDTITAYSLEDNKLWSRHLLQLVGQTGFASYVIFAGWTGSRVSFLTIPMMLAGFIKYGERTWILLSANSALLTASTSNVHNTLLQALSDHVEDYSNLSDDKLLEVAYGLFEMAKLLFAGVPIAETEQSTLANHQEVTTAFLEKTSSKDAFKVTEMQLGFMYDMLYTKSLVTYTFCGIGLRFTSFILTSVVLVLFSLEPNKAQMYSKVDLRITFLLLAVAILLELYATAVLILSDQTVVWLKEHKFSNISRTIVSHPLLKNPRWSNSMGQFSLFSYVLNEKTINLHGIERLLKFNEKLERQQYAAHHQVSDDLKDQLVMQTKIFWDRIKKQEKRTDPFSNIVSKNLRGMITLNALGYLRNGIIYSLTCLIEFQQTILVWHIATELCYHRDHDHFSEQKKEIKPGCAEYNVLLNRKISKLISRYMMYLLVFSPDKLPAAMDIAQINFQATCNEARNALESFKPELEYQVGTTKERKWWKITLIQTSKELFERYGNDRIFNTDQIEKQLNESLLSIGCKVANILGEQEDDESEEKFMERKWQVFAGIWMEFLVYAGEKCAESQHAQLLSQGGEFLTHFWLLYSELTALHGTPTRDLTDHDDD